MSRIDNALADVTKAHEAVTAARRQAILTVRIASEAGATPTQIAEAAVLPADVIRAIISNQPGRTP